MQAMQAMSLRASSSRSLAAPHSCRSRARLVVSATALPEEQFTPGQTCAVHSSAQIDRILEANKDRLVVAMCKSTTCKPCKAFMPQYHALAERFSDCVLLELTGDENPELRAVMKSWQIKTTPTFRLYRGGKVVNTVSGTRDNKVLNAVLEQLQDGEVGRDWTEVTQEEFTP